MQNVDISSDCRCHNRTQLFNNVNHDPQDLRQLWRSPQPQHDAVPQIGQRPPPEPGVRQSPEHQVVFRIGYAYLVETEDGRGKPLR
ncbi:hypothetical protein MTP99_014290 [Tenebrio molitor]|nr:hypothetical protein MTP99_014290 [Tenebrio molitor]